MIKDDNREVDDGHVIKGLVRHFKELEFSSKHLQLEGFEQGNEI